MVEWASSDIPDQLDRIFVITGANSGIGLETTRALSVARATVVMACRRPDAGNRAKAAIEADSRGRLTVLPLDLTDGDSIRRFADDVLDRFGQVDVLINNAGILAPPQAVTQTGIDQQWATNHLGHFALTGLLLPGFVERFARVVSVSSLAAAGGQPDRMIRSDGSLPLRSRFRWSRKPRQSYPRMGIYRDTKWANQVFCLELNHRLAAENSPAISVAAHPGVTHTNLTDSSMLGSVLTPAAKAISRRLFQSAPDGALPILRAATDPLVEGGQYYGPGGPGQRSGAPKQIPFLEGVAIRSHGRELWERSMTLTGVRYLDGS
ncbi:MAG: SDR family NAD(P)-dependent oxidoreductase [Actinomycetota bacterium]